jgi:hypothetical protein
MVCRQAERRLSHSGDRPLAEGSPIARGIVKNLGRAVSKVPVNPRASERSEPRFVQRSGLPRTPMVAGFGSHPRLLPGSWVRKVAGVSWGPQGRPAVAVGPPGPPPLRCSAGIVSGAILRVPRGNLGTIGADRTWRPMMGMRFYNCIKAVKDIYLKVFNLQLVMHMHGWGP